MPSHHPRSARDEAERLVAVALAAAANAARHTQGVATGSGECCACPVCRAIAAVRDPDPAFAERLASGVGDLAEGIASFLRCLDNTASAREDAGVVPRGRTGGPGEQ